MTENTRENFAECEQEYPGLDRSLVAMAQEEVLAGLDAGEKMDLTVCAARTVWAAYAFLYTALAAVEQDPAYGHGTLADAATEVACALRISERTADAFVG